MMQSFPFATAVAVKPETVGVQSASERARARGAEITEIAERLEIAKIKGIKDATRRRALRMKAARFNAIPMYSFTGPANMWPVSDRSLSE
jgi:hypothetical protein